MKNRDLRKIFKRKRKIRPRNELVLIIVPGSSDANYINDLRRVKRKKSATIQIKEKGDNNPQDMMAYALKQRIKSYDDVGQKRPVKYDQIFIILDYDNEDNCDLKRDNLFNLICSKYKSGNVQAIYSNPSFEIWICFHFTSTARWLKRKDAYDKAKKHIPSYSKSSDYHVYKYIEDYESKAIKNAKSAETHHDSCSKYTPSQRNPSSKLFILLDYFNIRLCH